MKSLISKLPLIVFLFLLQGESIKKEDSSIKKDSALFFPENISNRQSASKTIDDLPQDLQSVVKATLEEEKKKSYLAREGSVFKPEGDSEFSFINKEQNIAADFSSEGASIRTTRQDRDWYFNLEYVNAGVDSQISVDGNRLEIDYGTVTEWYVNRPNGLEQGFIVDEPLGANEDGLLSVDMVVETNLTCIANADHKGVRLADEQGVVYNYANLYVEDSNGKELDSDIELTKQGWRINVDDSDAVYPVIIDPTIFEDKKVKANDVPFPRFFGGAIDISGDTVVVSAYRDNEKGVKAGAIYVFRRDGGLWTQEAKLLGDDIGDYFHFGIGVQIENDLIAVSSIGKPGFGSSGDVYIFSKVNGLWIQEKKISTLNDNDYFAGQISLHNEKLIVSAQFEAPKGCAYIFKRNNGSWGQEAKITTDDQITSQAFGWSVLIEGDFVAVGSRTTEGSNVAVVYTFEYENGSWVEKQKLIPSGSGIGFGNGALDVYGDTLLIGARNENGNIGAAYVFEKISGIWTEKVRLTSSSPISGNGYFGSEVLICGDTLAIGEELGTGITQYTGVVYLYKKENENWIEKDKLMASDGSNSDVFSRSLAGNKNIIVVGASNDDNNEGSFYVFDFRKNLTVNTLADELDGNTSSVDALNLNPGGTGISLREAITAANNDPEDTVINFEKILFNEQSPGTIAIGSALPEIIGDRTHIDGKYRGVILDGNGIFLTDGLVVKGKECRIEGITIQNFFGRGIVISGTGSCIVGGLIQKSGNVIINNTSHGIGFHSSEDGSRIFGNYIGTNQSFEDKGNNASGVYVSSNVETDLMVGGDLKGQRNYIGFHDGSNSAGIHVSRGSALIKGNYIGVTENGGNIGNFRGIYVWNNAKTVVIEDNLIGYSSNAQILCTAISSTQAIRNNYIGVTDEVNGWLNVGGSSDGIVIDSPDSASLAIGGQSASEANYFGFHNVAGKSAISIIDGSPTIENNFIGTNNAGANFANSRGITLEGAADDVTIKNNTVGFSTEAHVYYQANSGTQTIQGNYLGVSDEISGWLNLGGMGDGIYIDSVGDTGLLIGGDNPGEENYIGNQSTLGKSAVTINDGSLSIRGNYIGTNSSGNNFSNSIGINYLLGADDVILENNTIGHSSENQIVYEASSGTQVIRANHIGVTDEVSGWLNVGGSGSGIYVNSTNGSGLTIGGTLDADSNYLAFHNSASKAAIEIVNGSPTVQGNYIGTNAAGDGLGNAEGILISGTTTGVLIGSGDPVADNSLQNIISNGSEYGINASGAGVNSIQFRGNSIYSNSLGAISLTSGANNNAVAPQLDFVFGLSVIGSGADPSALIDIYSNPVGETQARQWLGSGQADATGKFAIVFSSLVEGENITVTQTSGSRTSALSNAVPVDLLSGYQLSFVKGDFDKEALNEITYGGKDSGETQYIDGASLYNTQVSLIGANSPGLFQSVFGSNYFQGSEDSTQSELFSTLPIPLSNITNTSATTSQNNFILNDEQQGLQLTTSSDYANTRVRVRGTYAPSGEGSVIWDWYIKPESEFNGLTDGVAFFHGAVKNNVVIGNLEIADDSTFGVDIESITVNFVENDPGTLSAFSNLEIYRDDGFTPNQWDPGDSLVSQAGSISLSNVMDFNTNPIGHKVVQGAVNFLVVCDVNPGSFVNAEKITIQLNYNEAVVESRLHGAIGNWVNSSNYSHTMIMADMPTKIEVNTESDVSDGDTSSIFNLIFCDSGQDSKISLREAIEAINIDNSFTLPIKFDPTVFPPNSPKVISLLTKYDTIFQNGTIIDASNAGVILDGSNLIEGNGLNFNAENCEVYGLQIQNFPVHGIRVSGRSVTIGGGAPGQGNIIVSNEKSGIFYQSTSSVPTKILGNFIGTDNSGADLGNTLHGITVQGSGVVQIGGSNPTERNIIAFHDTTNRAGIHLIDGNVSIYGNLIGTNSSSSLGLNMGNYYGIQISDGVDSVTVGGTGSGERNTIVYSLVDQINVSLSVGSADAAVNIKNNLIGTGDSYDVPKGSGQDGIHLTVNGNHSVTIGGTGLNEGNEIGYHSSRGGIALVSSSQQVTVQGNYIGVSRTGVPMPNLIGLGFVEAGNHLVGSLDPSIDNSGANTIAHNTTWGILGIGNGSVFNQLRGNVMYSNGIAAVSHTAGSNFEIPSPLLNTKLDQNRISGSIVFPQFAEDAQVDIFRNNLGENQQREYVGQATVFTAGPNIGNFQFDVPNIQLGDNYTAVMTILGNTSAPASSITVPTLQASQSSDLESDGSFSITGTALPNATIHLIIDGVIVATTTADADGNYSFDLNIDLGSLSYTIEMILGDGQTFSLNSGILYSGHSRVFGFDRHYRTEDFIRGLQTTKLSEALNNFETNIDRNDGDDYEVHLHDAANNIIDITREDENHVVTNGPMNEIQSIGTFRTNVQYDKIGRLISYTETVNSVTTHYRLTWNYRDQLILIESSGNGVNYSPISAYAYYPTGMRSSKYIFATNKRQNYYGVNNQACEVYEFDGILGAEPSGPTQEFIYEDLDKPIAMFTNADGNGSTGAKGGREVYFYHCNPKGDVYALTAGEDTDNFSEGDVVERYDYSLFGDTYVMNESYQLIDAQGNLVSTQQESKSAFGNPCQYSGAWKDDESCFMVMFHRYYDSRHRGFLSRDPIEEFPLRDPSQEFYLNDPTSTGSLGNLYAYVENNPGAFLDPMGLNVYGSISESSHLNWRNVIRGLSKRKLWSRIRSSNPEQIKKGNLGIVRETYYQGRYKHQFKTKCVKFTGSGAPVSPGGSVSKPKSKSSKDMKTWTVTADLEVMKKFGIAAGAKLQVPYKNIIDAIRTGKALIEGMQYASAARKIAGKVNSLLKSPDFAKKICQWSKGKTGLDIKLNLN